MIQEDTIQPLQDILNSREGCQARRPRAALRTQSFRAQDMRPAVLSGSSSQWGPASDPASQARDAHPVLENLVPNGHPAEGFTAFSVTMATQLSACFPLALTFHEELSPGKSSCVFPPSSIKLPNTHAGLAPGAGKVRGQGWGC